MVSLAVSARAFAVNVLGEKPDRLLTWGQDRLRLEHGLIAGGLLLLGGVVIAGVIVGIWIHRGFGHLSEERLLVAGSVLIILGVQLIFSSFFLSILQLGRDETGDVDWPPPPPSDS